MLPGVNLTPRFLHLRLSGNCICAGSNQKHVTAVSVWNIIYCSVPTAFYTVQNKCTERRKLPYFPSLRWQKQTWHLPSPHAISIWGMDYGKKILHNCYTIQFFKRDSQAADWLAFYSLLKIPPSKPAKWRKEHFSLEWTSHHFLNKDLYS